VQKLSFGPSVWPCYVSCRLLVVFKLLAWSFSCALLFSRSSLPIWPKGSVRACLVPKIFGPKAKIFMFSQLGTKQAPKILGRFYLRNRAARVLGCVSLHTRSRSHIRAVAANPILSIASRTIQHSPNPIRPALILSSASPPLSTSPSRRRRTHSIPPPPPRSMASPSRSTPM
jgi:hypothetical protein